MLRILRWLMTMTIVLLLSIIYTFCFEFDFGRQWRFWLHCISGFFLSSMFLGIILAIYKSLLLGINKSRTHGLYPYHLCVTIGTLISLSVILISIFGQNLRPLHSYSLGILFGTVIGVILISFAKPILDR